MEYVAGEAITEYCDRRNLTTRERLELFLDVCDGVQHAHQKGIVHRDLKPSNLLVAQQDGRALAKVIDFGVARATTGRLGERTLHTVLGQIVGTLDYMSPEQADPAGTDVDTRSDIYSLGVVLYQLVSGLLPFEHDSACGLPFSAIQRTIREEDPPTPSTRLRRNTETAAEIATRHGTDVRALAHQLAGDLDWICLKALEKDPARRYSSASALADDVRRHLAHEPVLAGRPGALYRMGKFVRRNRVGVAAAVVVVGMALAGAYGIVSGRLAARASALVTEALRPQADAHLLGQLEQEANELWPAHPDKIPDLIAWQERALELLSRLEARRNELAAVRARAEPWTPDERARDRRTHPSAKTLEYRRNELESWLAQLEKGELAGWDLEQAQDRLLVLEAEIDVLEKEVAAQRTWRFESPEDPSRHAVLASLVAGLEELGDEEAGLLAPEAISPEQGWSVPKRLEIAYELEAGFAAGGEVAAAWSAALPAIREAYPDLALEPQMGLLPLGTDPDSGKWEFAHLLTGAPPVRGPDGRLERTASTGLVFVLLPGGAFTMGAQWQDPNGPNYDPDSRTQDPDWPKREGPPHQVQVQAFFLSKYEMTQAQWEKVCGENPSLFMKRMVSPSPLNPVNQVSWTDCRRVMDWLGLTLPTEEQWEYAARGGTTTVWWTGDDPASLIDAANLIGREHGSESPAIQAVGSFPANPFGLHDVIGNVTEWCDNHPYRYGTKPGSDPATLELHAARGGNAQRSGETGRSAARNAGPTELTRSSLGLRPARLLDE
jgi:formylglycine-generating enzyme required for sulfatase activity